MLSSSIEVRTKGSIHQKGLFAKQFIPEGTLVSTLEGPTYSLKEAQAWSFQRRKEFEWYGFQCGVDRYSLPRDMSREMNHSCDPNTWVREDTSLFARRDILADEEVTYDYSICDIDTLFDMKCHCGSLRCRGRITNHDYLNPAWQQQYGLNLPAHTLAAIERARKLSPVEVE